MPYLFFPKKFLCLSLSYSDGKSVKLESSEIKTQYLLSFLGWRRHSQLSVISEKNSKIRTYIYTV
jgi:hypothetical protein